MDVTSHGSFTNNSSTSSGRLIVDAARGGTWTDAPTILCDFLTDTGFRGFQSSPGVRRQEGSALGSGPPQTSVGSVCNVVIFVGDSRDVAKYETAKRFANGP